MILYYLPRHPRAAQLSWVLAGGLKKGTFAECTRGWKHSTLSISRCLDNQTRRHLIIDDFDFHATAGHLTRSHF